MELPFVPPESNLGSGVSRDVIFNMLNSFIPRSISPQNLLSSLARILFRVACTSEELTQI